MRAALAAIASTLGACQPEDSSLGAIGADDGVLTVGSEGTESASVSAGDVGDDGDDDSSDDGPGIKLDVASQQFDVGGVPPCEREPCPACTGVDLLFVIDDSPGMAAHQAALVSVFPEFVDALVPSLSVSTSIHVGVTSTTMGASIVGINDVCEATGDGGQPAAAFYETPDTADNGLAAAQGRLAVVGRVPFFALSGDATVAERSALATFFESAADLGEAGSEIEMSAAAAGWAVDPVNDDTNAGFIRDDGAVLVIIVVQDEPDQTPSAATRDLVARLVSAKEDCGGLECVVGGGFVHSECLDGAPLGALFAALGDRALVAQLPEAGPDPGALSQVLVDSFVPAIGSACTQIGASLSD